MINIGNSLIEWYTRNKRSLPWRNTKNPYCIWVSEIILQQTRVNQGLNYYFKFIEKYPDIFSLAESTIDELMKVWQGLGYYSRARNMHQTAKDIVNYYNGKFPPEYNDLLKLKGIGEYTASAISSFAFNLSVPVLDGNVYRVLSRLFGIFDSTQTASGKKAFLNKAQEIIINGKPGIFNQAIMEFGAIQCIPKNPDCFICPLKLICFAFEKKQVEDLPVKKKKIIQKLRYFTYIHIIHNEDTFIEKRTQNDIWKFLYQLPLIETKKKVTIEELIQDVSWNLIFQGVNYTIDTNWFRKRHILSHQKLETTIYKVRIKNLNSFLTKNYIKVPVKELNEFSFPRLLVNYLEVVNN